MITKLMRTGLAAGLLAATALTAVPALAQQTTLTLGADAADIGSLDPHFASSTSDRTLAAWIFGGLVRFQPGSTDPAGIEPDLAESWESTDDKLEWTFHLRQGVQWQGGYGEVTADDVVFSIEKAMNPDTSAFSGDYAAVDSVEAVDPYTVKVTLKNQIPSVLGIFANYAGGFIVSKAAFEERGESFARNPIGFGPFELDNVEPGVSATFKAHADYFRGAPQLETVVYRFLTSSSARDLAFVSGEIDASKGLADKQWLARSSAIEGAAVDIFDPAELSLLNINVTQAPFDDIKVRQAVAHAVNPEIFVQYRGPEFTRPGKSVIPSNNLGFSEDVGMYEYDPEASKALLEEAGYGDGLTVKMLASQLNSLESNALLLQSLFEEAGITLELEPVEHATWHQMIRQDLSPLVQYGAARFPVADVYLTQFFHSGSAIGAPGQVTNFSHCSVADEQIEAARVETDPVKQLALWKEAQELIVKEVCAVPMAEVAQVWVRKAALDWGYELKGAMSLGPVVTEATHFTE